MKKFFILACIVCGITTVQAQTWNEWNGKNILEHLGVGVGVGTTGISIEVGSDVTDYLTVRGGLDIFPRVSMDFKVKTGYEASLKQGLKVPKRYTLPAETDKVDITGKTSMGDGHLLFDIHPFRTGFRITAGLYFASSKVITVENKRNSDLIGVAKWNNDIYPNSKIVPGSDLADLMKDNGGSLPRVGLKVGDYFLAPDQNGHVDARIKVNAVRPYLGIGFGRMVPKNSRVTCNFDLGVQFWGKPKVYLYGVEGEEEVESSDFEGKDNGTLDIISKVSVYPTMTLRVVGRIF